MSQVRREAGHPFFLSEWRIDGVIWPVNMHQATYDESLMFGWVLLSPAVIDCWGWFKWSIAGFGNFLLKNKICHLESGKMKKSPVPPAYNGSGLIGFGFLRRMISGN